MKSKQKVFIVSIIVVVALVIGLGIFLNNPKTQTPSKYDEFAQALKSSGAEFYGAFWCPHCQAVKALFGKAQKYLPYIECSNPNRSQTAACTAKKIESYPTWYFKDGITVTSASDPTICQPQPGVEGEPAVCKQIAGKTGRTWLFPGNGFSVHSTVDPVKEGTNWKFIPESSVTGETPLLFLAQQIGFTLPQ